MMIDVDRRLLLRVGMFRHTVIAMQQRTKNLRGTTDPPELAPLKTAEEIEPIVGYKASTIRKKVQLGLFPCHRFGQKSGIGEIRFSDEDIAKIRALSVTSQQANSEIQAKHA